MKLSRKDEAAAVAIKDAVTGLFGRDPIDRIEIFPTEDMHGDPLLAVTVFLQAAQERVSGARLLDTIVAAQDALRELDDDRFPYVTFLAPEDESAEDARPAA